MGSGGEISWAGGPSFRENQTGEGLNGELPWSIRQTASRPCAPSACCPAIPGHPYIPGGWIFGAAFYSRTSQPWRTPLSEETKKKRMGADQFGVLCGPQAVMPSAHAPTLFRAMRTGKPYPVKAFLVFGNNGLVTYANPRQFYETLMKVDLLVVMELFMTPTAELADIVLPSATWLEADEVAAMPLIANNVILAQQKVVQIEECRQPEEVFIELARRLHLKVGQDSLEQVLDEHLGPLGITFEDLKQRGFVTAPTEYRKHLKEGFRTPSGKIELASGYMEMLGYDPLPYAEEPPESPISSPELAQEYPLVLTTGGRSQYFFCFRTPPDCLAPETSQRPASGNTSANSKETWDRGRRLGVD